MAARGIQLTKDNAGSYLIANELGVHFFDSILRARAPLSVGSDGSLTCAAGIPKGSMVTILDGDSTSMVNAAESAAAEAKKNLVGEAAGVLLFDCVCRGMILKQDFRLEIDAVRSVFRDVPIALNASPLARECGFSTPLSDRLAPSSVARSAGLPSNPAERRHRVARSLRV